MCFEGKGRLHFIDEKAKVNTVYYINALLPKLLEDCHDLMGDNFIFQQDGAPAHAARLMQQWLSEHCPDFIDKCIMFKCLQVMYAKYYELKLYF